MTQTPESMQTIAVAGGPGSYSEWAALQYLERTGLSMHILHATTSQGVLDAMDQNRARLGVLPLQNTTSVLDGVQVVPMTENALIEAAKRGQQVILVSCESVPVSYDLCTKGTPLGGITKVVSHEQVLAQCKRNLQNTLPGIPVEAYQDSALAGEHLINGTLPTTTAVIVPTRFTEGHQGLDVLQSNFQDNAHNRTFFAIVGNPSL